MAPVLFCFPQYCFGNSGSFMLSLNFRIICSISVNNVIGNLIVHVHACSVAKSYPALFDIMDCRPPGSAVHRIFHARMLEWFAISSSRGTSQPRNQPCISCTGRWIIHQFDSNSTKIYTLVWVVGPF